MESPSKDWIIGFTEGEGNFNVSLARNYKTPTWKYPFEFYPILQFRIFLREDDFPVLEKIKNTLGIGKIYKKNNQYQRNKGVNSRDQCVFYITSSKELLKLKDLFLPSTFHSKKANDMKLFFEILDLKLDNQHLNKEGYNKIIGLALQMNSKNRENFSYKPKDNPVTE